MSVEKIRKCVDTIEKKFGKGAVVNFEEKDNSIQRVSTGSLGLDIATGGGWARGRVIEIYGPESSGKSTIALHSAVEFQKIGAVVLYLDLECAFDPIYAEALGLDLSKDRFIFSQPDHGEQAFDIMEEFVKNEAVQFVVIDSVAALIPKAELEGEFGESKMGLQARLMSQAMRKLVGMIKRMDCTVMFINQLRSNIGVLYGPSEVTTGGNALKFYSSIRCDVRRQGQAEKDGEGVSISNKVKVKIVKNKTAPPFRECIFDIVYGQGISREGEILQCAEQFKIVEKKGSWYNFGEVKLGQGVSNVQEFLLNHPVVTEQILEQIKVFQNDHVNR